MQGSQDAATLKAVLAENARLRVQLEAAEDRLRSAIDGSGEPAAATRNPDHPGSRCDDMTDAYRRFVDKLPYVVLAVSADGRLGYCNERAAALLTPSSGSPVGRTLHELVAPGDAVRLRDWLASSLADGALQEPVVFCDGAQAATALRLSGRALPCEDGSWLWLIGVEPGSRGGGPQTIDRLPSTRRDEPDGSGLATRVPVVSQDAAGAAPVQAALDRGCDPSIRQGWSPEDPGGAAAHGDGAPADAVGFASAIPPREALESARSRPMPADAARGATELSALEAELESLMSASGPSGRYADAALPVERLCEAARGLIHELAQPLNTAACYAVAARNLARKSDAGSESLANALRGIDQQILLAGAAMERLRELMRSAGGPGASSSMHRFAEGAK